MEFDRIELQHIKNALVSLQNISVNNLLSDRELKRHGNETQAVIHLSNAKIEMKKLLDLLNR